MTAALSSRARAGRVMWTTAPPTVSGWYWARWAGVFEHGMRVGVPMTGETNNRIEMVHVSFWREHSTFPEDQDGYTILAPQEENSVYGFQTFDYWLGPITPPEGP